MKPLRSFWLLLTLLTAGPAWAGTDFPKLPLSFEENHGQAPQPAGFIARGSGYSIVLARGEQWIRRPGLSLGVRLAGAQLAGQLRGEDPLTGTVSYLRGERSSWKTGIPTFGRVRDAARRLIAVAAADEGRVGQNWINHERK